MQNALTDANKNRGSVPSRVTEKAEARAEINAAFDTTAIEYEVSVQQPHIFDGERCICCNVNVYDDMIYGPFECVQREAYNYSTETGDPSHD